jgi:hypothetical protein
VLSNFRRERREILKSREEISTKKIVICVLVIFLQRGKKPPDISELSSK